MINILTIPLLYITRKLEQLWNECSEITIISSERHHGMSTYHHYSVSLKSIVIVTIVTKIKSFGYGVICVIYD